MFVYVLLADDHVNNVSYLPFMSIKKVIPYFCVLREGYYLPVYLFPRSGIWAIQPLGPFLINSFHLPVGRYLVKILYPDFFQ